MFAGCVIYSRCFWFIQHFVAPFVSDTQKEKTLELATPLGCFFVKPLNFKAMQKYNGPSIRNVETFTGKIPDSVGFSRTSGYTRKLTRFDLAQQRRNLKRMEKSGLKF